jgi:hypothetical protein
MAVHVLQRCSTACAVLSTLLQVESVVTDYNERMKRRDAAVVVKPADSPAYLMGLERQHSSSRSNNPSALLQWTWVFGFLMLPGSLACCCCCKSFEGIRGGSLRCGQERVCSQQFSASSRRYPRESVLLFWSSCMPANAPVQNG